jgi:hypothetical protein
MASESFFRRHLQPPLRIIEDPASLEVAMKNLFHYKPHLTDIHDTVLLLPSPFYENKRLSYKVGAALKATDECLFPVWIHHLARNSAFSFSDTWMLNMWDDDFPDVEGTFNKLSIMHWANHDAHEEYVCLRGLLLDQAVNDAIGNARNKWDKYVIVMYKMFAQKYVYCEHGDCWYDVDIDHDVCTRYSFLEVCRKMVTELIDLFEELRSNTPHLLAVSAVIVDLTGCCTSNGALLERNFLAKMKELFFVKNFDPAHFWW